MTTWLLSTKLGRCLSAAGAAILVIIGAYLRGRFEGEANAKAKRAAERLKSIKEGDRIDADIGGRDPSSNREELKTWAPKR